VHRKEASMPAKLASLFGGFLCMLACGSVYGWGVVNKYLGASGPLPLKYTADDIDTMGTMGALSVYVTFHTGIFHDWCGARASLVLGGVLLVAGWILTMWGVHNHQPAVVIGIYQCLCGQSVQPLMLAAMENVKNFSWENRGKTSAVVFTGFGLTSVCMAQMKKHFFAENFYGLVTTMAIVGAVATIYQILTFTSPPVDPAEKIQGGKCQHAMNMCRQTNAQILIVIMGAFGMSLYYWIVNVVGLWKAGGMEGSVADLITYFGVCNIIARPVVGFSSDFLPFSRCQLMCMGMLIVSLTMFLCTFKLITLSAFAMGIADGFMFAVWPPLTRELHGMKMYGITFSVYLAMFGVGDVFINFVLGKTCFKPTADGHLPEANGMILPALFAAICSVIGAGLCLFLDRRIKYAASQQKAVQVA